MDASSRSALSRGVASFRVFLNSASSERSQRRTRRVLAVLACTLCGFQSYAAYAQATAAPTPVPPIPVDPSLLYNHPAVFEPGQPPLPVFPGAGSAGAFATLASLPAAVGRTPGSFSVSPTGAATYAISLWNPPGVRGIEPHLTLVYSSNQGNGLFGMGWSVSGLSSITRCNRTYAQDSGGGAPQLDSLDRFCLDGNRLRLVSGTYGADSATYQTEIANFSNVTSHSAAGSGPAYFTVQGKDGLTYEYGHTTNSAILASGAASVRVWALDKVSDRTGNSMTFSYTNDTTNGSYRPANIQYTLTTANPSSANYEVTFTYQSRATTDGLWSYSVGGVNNEFNLVSAITANTVSGGTVTPVKSYNFSYHNGPASSRSILTTIQECSPSDCLSPTTVGYQPGQTGWGAATPSSGNIPALACASPLDLNGDGLEDLLYPDPATGHWFYLLGTAAGSYVGPYDTGVPGAGACNAVPIDYNSDGKMDVLVPNASGNWRVLFFQSAGSAFTFTDTAIAVPPVIPGYVMVGDVDGDGRDDLIYGVSGGLSFFTPDTFYYVLNTARGFVPGSAKILYNFPNAMGQGTFTKFHGTPFTTGSSIYYSRVRRADFNGDGRIDFLANVTVCHPQEASCNLGQATFTYSNNVFMSQSNGTYAMLDEVPYGVNGVVTDGAPLVGDFDGDGCSDIAYTVNGYWSIQYGTCWRAGATNALGPAVPTGVASYGIFPIALDWDGDGRDDIVEPNSTTGTWGVLRSSGNGLSAWADTGISYANQGAIVTDVNGDGQYDIVSVSATTHAPYTLVHNGAGTPPDLATSFTDGYGMYFYPNYLSIARNGNYVKGTAGAYPDLDWEGPLYVVNSFNATDGTGGTYSQSFAYYYAQMNLQGRGFDGFHTKRSYDNRTLEFDYQYYSQTFPQTGMMTEDVLELTSHPPIRTLVNDLATTTLSSVTNNQRYLPYVQTSSEQDTEVGGPDDGNIIRNVQKSYTVDSYGNATTVATAVTDLDASSPWLNQVWHTVVTKTIAPNTTDWCLSLPTQVTVQKTTGSSSTLTRTTSLTPDYVNCRINSTIDEPTSTASKVTTTYLFDGCGNVKSTAVVGVTSTGTAMPARTTTEDFGTRCQLPETITNAQSEATTIAYRYDLGLPSSQTDPNGITTSWLYDNYGRKSKETRPDGTYTQYSLGNCIASGSCGGPDLVTAVEVQDFTTGGTSLRFSDFYFDGYDRQRYDLAQNITNTLTYSSITYYDALGRVHIQYMPFFNGAPESYHEYTVDLLNRVTADQFYSSGGLDRQALTVYAGTKITLTDPKVNAPTMKYVNVIGQLARITDPSPGGTTDYTYEPFGNLSTVLDAASPRNTTTYTYTVRGIRTASSDPDRGSWTYSPDSLGELVSVKDAKLQTTSFVFDKLGRMTSRTEAEGTSTWMWGTTAASHNIDRLQSMSGPGYSESNAYDTHGRLSGTNYSADTTYTINRAYSTSTGLLDNVTYPASTGSTPLRIQYGYTYGTLTQVNDFNTPSTIYWKMNAQDAWLHPTTEVLANGVQVLSNFDALTGHLNTRTSGNVSPYTNQQKMTFDWDKDENLTDRIDANQGNLDEHFNYDPVNRMTSSTLAGATNLSVSYDPAGNIASKSDVGTYTYNPTHTHAVASTTNGYSFTYDANGNMLTGRGATIGWTSYNLPGTITSGTVSSAFAYTPNRQYWKQTAQYANGAENTVYIGGVFEKVTGATFTDYHHLIPAGSTTIVLVRSTASNNATYNVTQDHLGSSSIVTNTTGVLVLNESFGAYGSRRGSNWTGVPAAGDYSNIASTTRHGFTGHVMLDNLNLIHMNGRVYDNVIGRFISADPTEADGSQSQGWNPYSYVNNNPASLRDPTGFEPDYSCMTDASGNNCFKPIIFGKQLRDSILAALDPAESDLGFGFHNNDDGRGDGAKNPSAAPPKPPAKNPPQPLPRNCSTAPNVSFKLGPFADFGVGKLKASVDFGSVNIPLGPGNNYLTHGVGVGVKNVPLFGVPLAIGFDSTSYDGGLSWENNNWSASSDSLGASAGDGISFDIGAGIGINATHLENILNVVIPCAG